MSTLVNCLSTESTGISTDYRNPAQLL